MSSTRCFKSSCLKSDNNINNNKTSIFVIDIKVTFQQCVTYAVIIIAIASCYCDCHTPLKTCGMIANNIRISL